MLQFVSDPLSLDAELYRSNPATFELATIVAEETEAERRAQGGGHKRDARAGLLGAEPLVWADQKHWWDFLAELSVIDRCCKRLSLQIGAFLQRVMDELRPSNWETFFWMRAYLLAVTDASLQAVQFDAMRQMLGRIEEKNRAQAIKRAKSKHQKLYGDAKAFVQREWIQHGQSAYECNKSAFGRDYSRRVLNEFETTVTERTIALSWLKGL